MTGFVLLLVAIALAATAARRFGLIPTWAAVVGWLVTSLGVSLVLLLQLALVSEGSLPPDDLAARLPADVRVEDRGTSCGSGGCARVFVIRPDPPADAESLARTLERAGLEGCRRRTWVPDFRWRCTDVDVIDARVVVHDYLQYRH